MRKFSKSTYDFSDSDTVSVIDDLPFWSAPFGIKLLDNIRLKPHINVIDVGSGLGFPLVELASRLGSTCKVYGLDPWAAALQRAKKKIDIFRIQNIELIEGVAENIPLPDSCIDLIVSNNGINNVQDINKVFKELNRIAKRGAQFAASVNLDGTMIEFYQIFEQVLKDFDMNQITSDLQKHIYEKRRPVSELKALLEDNGFGKINIIPDSFKYRFVDGTSMFDHPVIQYAFMDSWLSLVPENKINQVFQEIENRMNGQSQKNGEWILTIPFIIIVAEKS